MSNQVTLFANETGAQVAPEFKALMATGELGDDLGEGLRGGGFAVISKKGGKWRIKYKGEETLVTNADGDPVPSLELVIVKANPFINKQFYKGKWIEGSASPPDCFSLDGKVPSDQSTAKQHSNCAGCPQNVWGSKINEQGKKVKACQDTKKLAVVPLADIMNVSYNGPMLYRVTSSELGDLGTFADQMKGRGFPYNSVAVRMGFDPNTSHPKAVFKAIRPLTQPEAEQVLELFRSDATHRILAADFSAETAATETTAAAEPEAPPADPDFEQPPVKAVPAALGPLVPLPQLKPKAATTAFGGAATPQVAPKPTVVPPPPGRKKAPVAEQVEAEPAQAIEATEVDEAPAPETTQLDDDIAGILAGLDKLAG